MGSEMCIRDSINTATDNLTATSTRIGIDDVVVVVAHLISNLIVLSHRKRFSFWCDFVLTIFPFDISQKFLQIVKKPAFIVQMSLFQLLVHYTTCIAAHINMAYYHAALYARGLSHRKAVRLPVCLSVRPSHA